ncbi:MAG: hypothetical protein M3220_21445 [Chloroflexota bacterium]|nr:hypothetical protein [Chloroflexota bacterium]
MNPFTRFLRSLRSGASAPEIEQFVTWWDVVEAIVIDVNKRGIATNEEREAYTEARGQLVREYEHTWADRFAPHWPETREAGCPTPSDPFPRILEPETADGFVDNWPAMQALAAARETLNRYLLSLEE